MNQRNAAEFCLFAALLFGAALHVEAESKGLEVERGKVNLGEVFLRQIVEHEFVLENRSDQPIVITRIEKSCSCTSVSLDSDVVRPGASVKLGAAVATGGSLGELAVTVNPHWKIEGSKEEHVMSLSINASVVALAVPDPELISFGEVNTDGGERTVDLALKRGPAAQEWNELSVAGGGTGITTDLQRRNENEWNLRVTLDPASWPAGRLQREVIVKFAHNGIDLKTDLRMPIEAKLVSNVRAEPATLYFGVILPNEATTKEVVLSVTDPSLKPKFVAVISSAPDAMSVEQVVTEDDSMRFKCRISAGGKIGNRAGWLRFKVETDREREIVVPVIAYVKPAGTSSPASEPEKQ